MNEGLDAFLAGKSGLGNTNEISAVTTEPAVIETVVVEPPAPEPAEATPEPVESATAQNLMTMTMRCRPQQRTCPGVGAAG